jgi:hypothetical protein
MQEIHLISDQKDKQPYSDKVRFFNFSEFLFNHYTPNKFSRIWLKSKLEESYNNEILRSWLNFLDYNDMSEKIRKLTLRFKVGFLEILEPTNRIREKFPYVKKGFKKTHTKRSGKTDHIPKIETFKRLKGYNYYFVYLNPNFVLYDSINDFITNKQVDLKTNKSLQVVKIKGYVGKKKYKKFNKMRYRTPTYQINRSVKNPYPTKMQPQNRSTVQPMILIKIIKESINKKTKYTIYEIDQYQPISKQIDRYYDKTEIQEVKTIKQTINHEKLRQYHKKLSKPMFKELINFIKIGKKPPKKTDLRKIYLSVITKQVDQQLKA